MKKIFGFIFALLYDLTHTPWGLLIAVIVGLAFVGSNAKAEEPTATISHSMQI